MAEAYDLDAVIAEKHGTREPFRFKFDGKTYEIPAGMDMRALSAFTAGRLDEALRLMIGDEAWAGIQASPKRFDIEACGNLLEAYAAHSGIDLGESAGFTASSPNTVKPSKRTSNGTTRRTSATSAPRR